MLLETNGLNKCNNGDFMCCGQSTHDAQGRNFNRLENIFKLPQ